MKSADPAVPRAHSLFLSLLGGLILLFYASPGLAQEFSWRQTSLPHQQWEIVTSSSDGSQLMAVANFPPMIFISANSGTNWTQSRAPNVAQWRCGASSSNGRYLFAACDLGLVRGVFRSADSGLSWSKTAAPDTNWSSLACSADGTKLIGGWGEDSGRGGVYISTNSGLDWKPTDLPANGSYAATLTADGLTCIAANIHGKIYISRDSGSSWKTASAPEKPWRCVACSPDGTRLAAATQAAGLEDSEIYLSNDSGATWQRASDVSVKPCVQLCFAATGTNLFALCSSIHAGSIYASGDSGATWKRISAINTAFSSIATSAGGSSVIAASEYGEVYLAQTEKRPATPSLGTETDGRADSGAPKLSTRYEGRSATLLPDGKWLVAGGLRPQVFRYASDLKGKLTRSRKGGFTTDAVLFDPANDRWMQTGSMTDKRGWHAAALTAGGKVLVMGGNNEDGDISTAELYDPATGDWKQTDSLKTARRCHTATSLPDGTVLVTGGIADRTNYPRIVYFAGAELYDPKTEKWTTTSPMSVARASHTATLLTNGLVLVPGGVGEDGNFLFKTELYDPSTGKWTPTGSMTSDARFYYAAKLLSNGQVLLTATAGSYPWQLTNAWAAAKLLYDPPSGQWAAIGPPRPHFVSATNLDRTLTIRPESGTEFLASEEAHFLIESADRFGVTNIQLLRDGIKIAEVPDSPMTYTFANQKAGTYTFMAEAAYANGLSSSSAPVSITFKASEPQLFLGLGPTEFISDRYVSSSPATLRASIVGMDPGAITNLTLNGVPQPIKTGNFILNPPLVEGENTFVLAATDNQGRTARDTNSVYLDSVPPIINITQPANGSSFNLARVGVRGTFAEKWLKQITVNGMPAFVRSNTFEVPNVFLEIGTNTIAAVAEDLAGNVTTNSIVVTGPADTNAYNIDPVQLIADPVGGFAPLKVVFKVKASVPGQLKRVLYDFDGDHVIDKIVTDLQPIAATFAEPGERFPMVTLETTAGQFSSTGQGFWFTVGTRVSVQAPPVQLFAFNVTDPVDIKCKDTNSLYVLSGATATLAQFDPQGRTMRSLKNIGGNPTGFDVDEHGNIYVALNASNQVWKFTPTTNSFAPDVTFGDRGFIGNKDGSHGSKSNELNAPFDVAVGHDFEGGGILVSDSGNHRIERFSSNGRFMANGYQVATNGEFQSSFGKQGTNTGEFNQPKGLSLAGVHQYVFIADSGNDRVTVAHPEYGPLAAGGASGSALGEFRHPTKLCASDRGLCVVDSGNDRIELFDPVNGGGERGPLVPFGPRCSFSTELKLRHPSAVAWLDDLREDKLYVADRGNNRVILIKLPMDNPESTWEAMKQHLRNGDIEGAISFFASGEADKYRRTYLAMGTNEIAKIMSEIPAISPVTLEREEAEYYFEQRIQGTLITFPIHFVREGGKWKILEY